MSTAYAQSWEELAGSATGGGVSNNSDWSFGQSLALDSSSNPHIAWEDWPLPNGDPEIYYAYWDGTNWVTHDGANTGGGVSNNSGDSVFPSLALDSSGNPHIAWNDSSGGNVEIYYRYWNPCPSLLPKICRTCPPKFSVKQGKTKCKLLKIRNCGKGTLNWTVSKEDDCPWLTLSPSSGTLARTKSKVVRACVDTTGLDKGDYECTVTIAGECATNSPQTCVIRLKVK